MKKVVFCEVAWMEYYDNDPEDKPKNGGSYVKENGTGMERFNYLPVNHYCYGYVMHQGNELHIERYDKTLQNYSEVGDVTVIWVATDGCSSKIVGWYEHATMYRDWQFRPEFDSEEGVRWYNFKAREEDCYLVPLDKRDLEIPRAPKEGAGKGMGQSQVWYADSDYAQEVVVPKVMEYIENNREQYQAFIPLEMYKRVEEDTGESSDQLIDHVEKMLESTNNLIQPINMLNLSIVKKDSFKARGLRGDLYKDLRYYDEALSDYDRCLEFSEDGSVLAAALFVADQAQLNEKIKDYGARLLIIHKKLEKHLWEELSRELVNTYIYNGYLDEAIKLLIMLENEKNEYDFSFIEDAWKFVKTEKERVNNGGNR